MANNEYKSLNTSKRVIMVDPNPNGMGLVPLEDLCIIVDLQTNQKSRSNISTTETTGNIQQNDGKKLTVNFISGSDQNGVRNLTTNYTNIGNDSYKSAKSILNTDSEDLEGLGITNIDISFNSSYAPQIVIDMIDIRGSSILEYGNTSKYNVFFNMPYPIFKLTVKGYYGQAVTYCLHLTKWNAKFNSQTGNFEIRCEFIGHTYAFLTDMLIGYLRAAVETSKGKALLNGKKAEHLFIDGIDTGKLKYPNLMTISELIGKIDLMAQNLDKIKQSNNSVKDLEIIKRKISDFDGILQQFNQFITNHSTVDNINKFSVISRMSDGVTVFNNTRNVRLTDDINNLEELLSSTVENINQNTNTVAYKLTKDNYKKNSFVVYDGTIDNFKSKSFLANQYINKISVEKYNSIISSFGVYPNDTKIIITDWSNAIKEIEFKKIDLKKLEKTTTTNVTDEIANIVDGDIGLTPSIRNIMTILAVHVDIFMELIRGVAIECEKGQGDRTKVFEKALDNLDIKTSTSGTKVDGMPGLIYPFPGYDESGVEKWIGNKINNIPETNFIEELLIGFLTVAKSDAVLESNIENGGSSWYPSCILNTSLLNSVNTYETIKDVSQWENLLDDVYKRLFLFYGFANSNLSTDELKNMAIIEANNVYKYITNKTIRDIISIKPINDLINEMLKLGKYQKSGDLYHYNDFITINDSNIAGRFIKNHKIDSDKKYLEIYDTNQYDNGLIGTIQPYELTGYKSSENIINLSEIRDNKYTSYDALAGLYKSQEFFKYNYDGATRSYDVDLLFWSNLDQGSGHTFSVIVNSFDKITDTGGINAKVIDNYKQHNQNYIDKHFIGFDSNRNLYSLFGSELYFRQLDNIFRTDISISDAKVLANRAKAILFLHTLPFDGLTGPKEYGLLTPGNDVNDIGVRIPGTNIGVDFGDFGGVYNSGDDKINLFKNRGGFVKVPKSWVLLVGGLLWRKQQSIDPIKFNNSTHSFFIDTIKVPTVNNYLKNITILNTLTGSDEPESFGEGNYVNIEDIFNNLPIQAIKALTDYFIIWADSNNWSNIRKRYELENTDNINSVSDYNNLITARNNAWIQASAFFSYNSADDNGKIKTSLSNNSHYNKSNFNICSKFYISENMFNYNVNKTGNDIKPNYSIEYINTSGDTSSNSINDMIREIIEPVIIANATWRIWVDPDNDDLPVNYTNNFSITSQDLTKYLTDFQTTLKGLSKNNSGGNSDEEAKSRAFGIIDNDIIKLNLYRTVKAIYDKWIAGTKLTVNGICNCSNEQEQTLISSFRFLNKAFQDIGDDLLINPITIRNMIKFNTNQSFYDLTSQILVGNNMDFIPLPNFINYRDPNQIEKMFSAFTYNDAIDENTIGPTFICMYVGQPSRHLDIDDSNYPTDSIQFIKDSDNDLPDAFKDPNGDAIPVFAVNYAQGNQSVFKSLQLDQSEFSETDESLRVIDEISLQGDKLNRTPIGQNLFNVYSTRSYQTEIEMLGNAMIQPMMYFQLNNIPMFRGGYLINRTSHNIKPNHMTTKFKGVRVNRIMTPLLDRSTLFMNLLGSLSEVDVTKSKLTAANPTDITYTAHTCNNITDSNIIAFYDYIKPENINPKGVIPNTSNYITRDDFITKLVQVSNNLNVNANWLITAMLLESGIKVDNGNKGGSGANGLIQWMPSTISGNEYISKINDISKGKNWGNIAPIYKIPKMNGIEQLELVEIFYKDINKNNLVKSFYDVAVYAFAPGPFRDGKLISDDSIIYDSINNPKAVKGNSTFDLNNDGIITYGEFKEIKYKALNSRGYSKYLNDALCTRYVGPLI